MVEITWYLKTRSPDLWKTPIFERYEPRAKPLDRYSLGKRKHENKKKQLVKKMVAINWNWEQSWIILMCLFFRNISWLVKIGTYPSCMLQDVPRSTQIYGSHGNAQQPIPKLTDDTTLMVHPARNYHRGCIKKPINKGINYQPQLVDAGFLSHQQYHQSRAT